MKNTNKYSPNNKFTHGVPYYDFSLAVLVRKILFSPLKNNIYIFAPPCNILYLLCTIFLYCHWLRADMHRYLCVFRRRQNKSRIQGQILTLTNKCRIRSCLYRARVFFSGFSHKFQKGHYI